MKLKTAAKRFDTCPVYDAYTGLFVARIQTSTFLESAAEGSTSAKRVISTAPEVTLPTHNALLVLDQLTLIGGVTPDEWNGTTIRKAYWTKKVSDNFSRMTPGQAALNATGTATYGQKDYLRETINAQTDASLDAMWRVYLSASIVTLPGTILKAVSTYYRVRTSYQDVDGFLTCMCDELDYNLQSVSFTTTSAYNPITDTYTAGTTNTTGIMLDFSKVYAYKTAADPKAAPGDYGLVVAKTAITPTVGGEVTALGAPWRIFATQEDQDAWVCHIRRA